MWLADSLIAIVTPDETLKQIARLRSFRAESSRPTESSVVFLFAPNAGADNSAYSAIENSAQEKLNYGATEYCNKGGRLDVESTQLTPPLLLTTDRVREQ
jgi:hypothetical protein